MGIGTGILLIAVGAVLSWAVDVDLPYIADDAMGLILVLAGLAVLVVSLILKANRPEAGVGTGIVLIAAGAVLSWAVDVDLPYIADDAMGVILIVAGGIAVVATVIMSLQRSRHRPPVAQDGYGPGQAYNPQQGNRW